MKKILMILSTLILVLPLSACGINNQSSKVDKQTEIVQKNKKQWNKQIADLQVENQKGLKNSSAFIPTSMEKLKQGNANVIQGTVYNLQKMKSPENMAYTKATIHVDKVISGDKSLKGKNVFTSVDGGITTANNFYKNMNQTREANHNILVQFQEFPTPKVGAKVIVGISPVEKLNANNSYDQTLKNNKFNLAKTYYLQNVQYGLWVKNPKDDKYHLNNPLELKRLSKDLSTKNGIEKLTIELNQKFK